LAITTIRTIILFLVIMVSMRIMGKRQLGELEPAEFVIAVLISELASQPLQDIGTPLLYGLIPVLTLFCCQIIISALIMKSIPLRAFISGKPSIIIENGKIVQQEMKKNRITVDELAEELRKKGISDISTIKYAVLETDGTLSTLLYAPHSPVTPAQMNLAVNEIDYQVIVINDGKVLYKNIYVLGYNEAWLREQLISRNIACPKDVYLMTSDRFGNVYFAARD